jgi:hypothetical protein
MYVIENRTSEAYVGSCVSPKDPDLVFVKDMIKSANTALDRPYKYYVKLKAQGSTKMALADQIDVYIYRKNK